MNGLIGGKQISPIFCGPLSRRNVAIILYFLGFSLVYGSKQGNQIPTYAGPYRILPRYILNTSEEFQSTGKFWVHLRTTQVRGKQPLYVWGKFYLEEPITDTMRVEASLAIRSNNQWKKNAFVFKFDRACSLFLNHARPMAVMLVGKEYNCPCPPVPLREIKNQTFEFVFRHFPVMPYGRYLFTLLILQGKIIHGVAVSDVDFVPRL